MWSTSARPREPLLRFGVAHLSGAPVVAAVHKDGCGGETNDRLHEPPVDSKGVSR
jgi:hypothetical protein